MLSPIPEGARKNAQGGLVGLFSSSPGLSTAQNQGPPAEAENAYLQARIDQLHQVNREMQQQINSGFGQTQMSSSPDVADLQRRVRDAESKETRALQAHEARLQEISRLEKQIFMLREDQATQQGTNHVQATQTSQLERQLAKAKAAAATHEKACDEQKDTLEYQAKLIESARNALMEFQDLKVNMERNIATERQEKEVHKATATRTAAELQQVKVNQQDTNTKIAELLTQEKAYNEQMQEDRRRIGQMEKQLQQATGLKKDAADQTDADRKYIENLEGEMAHLASAEVFHKSQCELHRTEVLRLNKLQDAEKTPSFALHLPLKALEERVAHLALFMMMGLCALPIMAAIALLNDKNYVFWLGTFWPHLTIAGCVCVFALFAVTLHMLLNNAVPESRSRFTMALTWATFAALLGVMLVPMGLFANKAQLSVAASVSQGCLGVLPQSEMLVDYGQVLYNMRLQPSCVNKASVESCPGWAANTYTTYLQHLESEFQCGPLCPEVAPPARLVQAPAMYNTPLPTIRPQDPSPPLFGPPLQGVHSFLQTAKHAHRRTKAQETLAFMQAMAPDKGIMRTALPHMQTQKLFSKGSTRMTCYPLVATRLQVLTSTFSGLWYWEGIGLIVVSFLTSLYAVMQVGMATATA